MSTEFIELAGKVNQQMPYFCLEKIERALNDVGKPVNGSRILLVGVSYKPGVGDLRESPALKILELLRARGGDLAYHDPHVAELSQFGLRKRRADERVRPRGDRHRPPGSRSRRDRRARAAGARPARRHARPARTRRQPAIGCRAMTRKLFAFAAGLMLAASAVPLRVRLPRRRSTASTSPAPACRSGRRRPRSRRPGADAGRPAHAAARAGVAAAERESARGRLRPGLVTIQTWVHVISTDGTPAGGNVSNAQIRAQIRVLNRSFSGATGGAPTIFRFALAGVTRTINPKWSAMEPESETELKAKTALHRGGPETLNIYVGADRPALAGLGVLPERRSREHGSRRGCRAGGIAARRRRRPLQRGRHRHARGRALAGAVPYVRERLRAAGRRDLRHALRGRAGVRLRRQGTPAHSPVTTRSRTSWTTRTTPCMHEFTLGQSLRMWGAWRIFRD